MYYWLKTVLNFTYIGNSASSWNNIYRYNLKVINWNDVNINIRVYNTRRKIWKFINNINALFEINLIIIVLTYVCVR